jgi:excisionase family DNA binding protein
MSDQTIPNTERRLRKDESTQIDRMNGPLVLSVPKAAALLGISRALAYELVARQELPSLRLGRRVVVPRRALLRMLEAEE